jgi:ribosome maturation factor RimP
MKDQELNTFIGKQVTIFVRYGFKRKVDETQSYQGKLLSVEEHGVVIERLIPEAENIVVNDFFPWHNIDAIRFRIND